VSHLHISEVKFTTAVHVFVVENFDVIQLYLIYLLQRKSICILKGCMSFWMLPFDSIHLFSL
jgi:hypothetical protein